MTVFRWIFALLVVGAVAFMTMKSLRPQPKPPQRVQTAKADRATVTRTVTAAGKLEPRRKVNVSSNITGTLVDLQVGIGSVVTKGQYLGQIDTSRYEAQLNQQKSQAGAALADVRRAAANLTRLRSDAARLDALVAKGAGNASDLEQARDQIRMAEAEMSAAQSRAEMARAGVTEAGKTLGWATLTAPIDGTVLGTNHRVGERIRGSDFAEDVVLVIGSLNSIDVRVEVGEHDVVYIKPGQVATIEVDALPDVQLKGKVIDSGRDAIVKNAGTDNEVTTFPVWISLDAAPDRVLPGMSAQVSIATETRPDVVAVPLQAVTVRAPAGPPGEGGGNGKPAPASGAGRGKLEKVVFVVKDGVVSRRKVATGLSSETHLEISQGLEAGEEVVEGPYRVLARQLEDGMKVEVGGPEMSGGRPGGRR
jgi:HlyD family secretion protein